MTWQCKTSFYNNYQSPSEARGLRYWKSPFGGARILAVLGFWRSGACVKGGLGGLSPFEGATSTPPRWAHNGDAHVTGAQSRRSLSVRCDAN